MRLAKRSQNPALIKINGGEVVLKWLSVEGSSPCLNSTFYTPSMSLIHFTGKDRSDATCKPDTIKGEVDRVRINALDGEPLTGVSASTEGTEPAVQKAKMSMVKEK